MTDKKQITLAVILMALIALFFWTQSRFPALDIKAQMGQRTNISAIAFDVILPVEPSAPFIERVSKSAINWGYTNWKGMSFGLIFAAAFFTLLQLLPTLPPSRFHFINSLKGMIIGVPLGVCANCSTPIAHGMVQAGTRIETALATLTSSPTLNIFVLSMSFALLPFHLAVIKVIGVFIFVLLIIPFLVHRFTNQSIDSHIKADNLQKEIPNHPLSNTNVVECELPSANWQIALSTVIRKTARNLWLIAKATVPLMILAGILGAIAIESISFTAIAESKHSIFALLGISLIGAFLPVPIAFDIIIVTTLLAAGFPVGLSMALLFSLGIFSIYPAMVIAKNVSVQLSTAMFVSVILLSSITGFVAERYNDQLLQSATNVVSELSIPELTVAKLEVPTSTPSVNIRVIAQSQCSILEDQLLRATCITEAVAISTAQTPTVTGDQSNLNSLECNALTDHSQQMQCFSKLSSQHAIQTNDITKCTPIGLPDIRDNCKKTIVLNKIRSLYTIESIQLAFNNTKDTNTPDNTQLPEITSSQTSSPTKEWEVIQKKNNITISGINFSPSKETGAGTTFKHVSASTLGINLPPLFFLSDFYEPFKYGRGIASGDFNNDNFSDLAFGTAKGPVIYRNNNGRFQAQSLELPKNISKNTFLVSFVDFNNDGWLDLFFSTYGGQNYIINNTGGQLDTRTLTLLPNVQTSLTMAAGFIDKDKDGDLDIFAGNWTAGAENNFSTQFSQNAWLINQGDNQFTLEADTNTKGETLSVLFSDFTADNNIDLITANDNQAPDLYFKGLANGDAQKIPTNNIIPSTSLTTMSVDTADFNNDLLLDIFTTDMSFGEGETPSYCTALVETKEIEQCLRNLEGWSAIKQVTPQHCSKLENAIEKQQCIIAFIIYIAKTSKDPSICEKINANNNDKKLLCQRMASRLEQDNLSLSTHIPQVQSNKLMLADSSGRFVDATENLGVTSSFWSWNSKAADLDNDTWQDILVANGFGFGEIQNEIHSNVFFHNQTGTHFKEAADAFGLSQRLNTPTYTYSDIDLDGDIDIISTAIMAQPQIYINQSSNRADKISEKSNGNNISFSLRDYTQNRFCIGCKIQISYSEQLHQIREIKLSGGFLSFDDPVAYFGLGPHQRVTHIKITWSDGQHTQLEGDFKASARYKIERKP